MSTKETRYCKKCNKTIDATNFYISKNLNKYPDGGKVDVCKKCMTMHVNSWQPTTFINILKEIDVPFIEIEWNRLLDKYGKDPTKVTGMTILGRYLSKMKLNQFAHLTWEDTEELMRQATIKKKVAEAQILSQQNRYAAALSSVDIKRIEGLDPDNLTDEDLENLSEEELSLIFAQPDKKPIEEDNWTPWTATEETESVMGSVSTPSLPEDELTDEDRKFLTLKWGKLYRPEEWISLEKFYEEMMDSFDIQGAGHIDTLKMICKTSLKMNQAIDCGDIDGFVKLQKAYDTLMKAGKFTAAQNKAESGEFVDSVGEIVYLCEEQGFIPRYHTQEGEEDIVDKTLKDMMSYTKRLVTEEMGLGNMIEAALQQMQREQEQEEGELDENDDFLDPDSTTVLNDADFQEYYDELETQSIEDEEIAKGV